MRRLTQEFVEKQYRDRGYILLDKYKTNSAKMTCSKDGYLLCSRYVDIAENKKPSLWGIQNIENCEHNVKHFLSQSGFNTQYISHKIIQKSKRKRILIHLQCQCGKMFKCVLDDLIYKHYPLCNDCTIKKRNHIKTKSQQNIKYIESCGYRVIDKTQLCKSNDYTEVMDSEGYYGFVKKNGLQQGKQMSKFDIRINKKHYIYNVNHYCQLHNIKVQCTGFSDVQKYARLALDFQCDCGNTFSTTLAYFQSGKMRCDICAKSISRYEYEIQQYLDENNINYIHQYSYNQCRDVLPLPFDFYLNDYNCLIEVDGEGHYRPVNFNHISHKETQKVFDITKQHDEIKNKFCQDNNIPLLRIPYWEIKNKQYIQSISHFIKSLAPFN